jgi:hypothetical protein
MAPRHYSRHHCVRPGLARIKMTGVNCAIRAERCLRGVRFFSSCSFQHTERCSIEERRPVSASSQSFGPTVAIGIVVCSCAVIVCVKHGIDKCARHFPDHTNPLSTDYVLFPKGQLAAAQGCVLLNFAADPFGSTATEVGGKIGEALKCPEKRWPLKGE